MLIYRSVVLPNNDKIEITHLKPEHADAGAELSARSFIHLNKIWKAMEGQEELVKSFFLDKINHALQAER